MFTAAVFVVFILLIGYCSRRSLAETIPVGYSIIILLMFIFSFFNKMQGYILLLLLGIIAIVIYLYFNKNSNSFLEYFRAELFKPSIYITVLLIILLSVSYNIKIFMGNDDIRYWGAATKAIYLRNGYEPAFCNINPNFGDYPQGLMFILCFFMYIRGGWHENVLYIGFMLFALSFIIPIFDHIHIKKKNEWPLIPLFAFVVYSISSSYTRFGISLEPDRAMAIVFAGSLASIALDKDINTFTFLRTSLYGITLCLLKSIGFVWMLFSFLFLVMNITKKSNSKKAYLYCAFDVISPVAITIVWNIFCKITHRTTYLSQNAFSSFQSSANWIQVIKERAFIIRMFFENFFLRNLNCTSFGINVKGYGINLSPFGFIILFIVLLIYIWKRYQPNISVVSVKTAVLFISAIGILYHIVLLWSYIFMFYNEFNVENPWHMQNMTSHYLGPFYFGTLILLLSIIIRNNESTEADCKQHTFLCHFGLILPILIMVLLSNYPFTFYTLWGYREEIPGIINERQKYHDKLAQFEGEINEIIDGENTRIAFITDDGDSMLKAYMYCFASPISIYYLNLSDMNDKSQLQDLIQFNHCKYIFYYSDSDNSIPFGPKLLDANNLYRISEL